MRFVKKCFWQLFASVGSGNSNCGKSTLCTVLTLLPWKCDWLKRQRPALLLGHNLNNFFSASSEQNTFFHNCLVSAGVIHRSFDHQRSIFHANFAILPYCCFDGFFLLLFNFILFFFFLSVLSIRWCRWILVSAGSVPNRGHCPGLDLHSCPHVGGKVGSDDIISLIVYHYIWIYTIIQIWYNIIWYDYIWLYMNKLCCPHIGG